MVERYGGLAGGIVPADDGPWVRYSDYMVMEADRDFWKERLQVETRARIEAEALSRTGAVKALEWREFKALGGGVKTVANDCFGNEFRRFDMRLGQVPQTEIDKAQADYERRILSALEPAAPEGQQPVACWPAVDLGEKAINGATIAAETQGLIRDPLQKYVTLEDAFPAISAARPSEQAVTEAMVEAAVSAAYPQGWALSDKIRIEAALKAAMEAGRHD